jgi:imidazolonepropionase-like amidohydrolase
MKSAATILLTLWLLFGSSCASVTKDATAETTIAIVGGTLIDGAGGPAVRDAAVIVRGNRIAAVGKKGAIPVPANARVINAEGKYILPGLIDAHVHYHEWQGELHLAHGVTTVMDTGNPIEWMEALSAAIADGRAVGPRLFYTGNSLTSPPALRDHHIGLTSPEMGRQAVRLLKQHGAISIKVHQQISTELLSAVAEEAHRLGLTVTGHLRRIGAREAALAGIDGLQHSTGIPRSTGDHPELRKTDDPENDLVGYYDDLYEAAEMKEENFASLIKLLVEQQVTVIPTLVTWFRVASENRAAYAQEDAVYARIEALRYVPEEVRKMWQTSAIYEPANDRELARFRAAYLKLSRFLKLFHEAGGRLLAGSSTSVMVPGVSLQREMEMMVELGLSPKEVIEMTTRRNAEFMRQDKELGTIAAGKLADLILVEGDPLAEIKNIRRIALVMKDGQVIDRNYHADYAMPIPRPKLERPVWLERQLK